MPPKRGALCLRVFGSNGRKNMPEWRNKKGWMQAGRLCLCVLHGWACLCGAGGMLPVPKGRCGKNGRFRMAVSTGEGTCFLTGKPRQQSPEPTFPRFPHALLLLLTIYYTTTTECICWRFTMKFECAAQDLVYGLVNATRALSSRPAMQA